MDRIGFPGKPPHPVNPVNPVLIEQDFIPSASVFVDFCESLYCGSLGRRPEDRGGQESPHSPTHIWWQNRIATPRGSC